MEKAIQYMKLENVTGSNSYFNLLAPKSYTCRSRRIL